MDDIIKHIKQLSSDIKAEVLLASLVQDNQINHLMVHRKGQSKRSYRRDILDVSTIDYQIDSLQYILIELSRDGIYDMLPEAFFHAPRNENPGRSSSDMIADHKRLQKEENNAREFFHPFENEFFVSSMKIDQQEKQFLTDINSPKSFEFLYQFWELDKSYPPHLIAKLIWLLPLTSSIVGDIELTAKCLEFVIAETVTTSRAFFKEKEESNVYTYLGQSSLGLDSVVGNEFTSYSIDIEFTIGPIVNTTLYDYIHNGGYQRFIELFFEHFLPIEVEPKINFIIDSELQAFVLNEDCHLSITTTM